VDPVGGNWTKPLTNDCQIVSGTLKGSHATSGGSVYWNADVPANDQYSEITIAAYDGTAWKTGAGVRWAITNNNGYVVQVTTTGWRFARMTSNSATVLGAAQTRANSVGDVFRLTVVGTVLTCSINGVEQAYTYDTDQDATKYASGRLAIWFGGGTSAVEAWAGGNASAPPTSRASGMMTGYW